MSNIFADEAWEDYTDWQIQDKKIAMRINELIKDINGNGDGSKFQFTRGLDS